MRTTRLPRRLALALLVGLAAVPASADAARLVTYSATIEGRVDADHTDRSVMGGSVLTTTGKGGANFKGEIAGIRFLDGQPLPGVTHVVGTMDVKPITSTKREFTSTEGFPAKSGGCIGTMIADDANSAILFGAAGPGGSMRARVLVGAGSLRVHQNCSGELFGPTHDYWLEDEDQDVHGDLDIPAATIGDDVIVQTFRDDPSAPGCPNESDTTVLCTFSYTGTITLRKTGDEERHDAPPAPPTTVPVGPAPAPPGPAPAVPVPVGPVAPPRVTTGKLPPKLSAYEVAIRCRRVGCNGTVKAYPKPRSRGRGGRARSAAAPAPLATARFTSATDSARARLRFDAADRAAIRRAGGIRLVVTTADAPAVTRTVTLARR
jgi:hypothetical protein